MTAEPAGRSDWEARYDASLAEEERRQAEERAADPITAAAGWPRVVVGLGLFTVVMVMAGVALLRIDDLLARLVGVMLLTSLALALGSGAIALVRRVTRRR